ncbi:MAG: hypothetical protein MHPSP_003185, partial [Paramarteilia canceri]
MMSSIKLYSLPDSIESDLLLRSHLDTVQLWLCLLEGDSRSQLLWKRLGVSCVASDFYFQNRMAVLCLTDYSIVLLEFDAGMNVIEDNSLE